MIRGGDLSGQNSLSIDLNVYLLAFGDGSKIQKEKDGLRF